MKRTCTLVFLLFLARFSFSQPGALDSDFGNNGIVITTLDEDIESSNMVLQPDGKIVVCGIYYGSPRKLVVIRYNADGSMDLGFATNGVYISNFRVYDSVKIGLQADGKIVAIGIGRASDLDNPQVFALRLLANGTPDATFGNGGYAQFDLNEPTNASKGRALVIAPNGKIIICGTQGDGVSMSRAFVLRLNANGTVDPSFGDGGWRYTDFTPTNYVHDLKLRPNGGFVMCGRAGAAGYLAVWAFTASGVPDSSFSQDGLVLMNNLNPQIVQFNEFYSVETGADGKIYALGRLGGQLVSVRFNTDGTLDNNYGMAGIARILLDELSEVLESEVDNAGRIVAVGRYFDTSDQESLIAVRFATDGTMDETFGNNGLTEVDAEAGYREEATGVAIRPDQKIVVFGGSNASNVERFLLVGLQSGMESSVQNAAGQELRLGVYPNPVTAGFRLEYETDRAEDLSLLLLDASGKTVQTFFSAAQHQKGLHQEYFFLNRALEPGHYQLALRSGSGVWVVPLVVVK